MPSLYFVCSAPKSMDTKTPYILLSTISRYQVSDHLAWGSHTPLCSYSQPSKCNYHASRQSNLPRDYFVPRHSPGSRQSFAHIAALVDSHTVSCSVVNHHHPLNSFVPLFGRGFLLDAICLWLNPNLWADFTSSLNGRQFVALIFHQCLAHC